MFAGLAAGYATARPPVHQRIIDRLRAYLSGRAPVDCAVDIGCGAGLSTRALNPVASRRIGLEPAAPMLRFASSVDPGAWFAAAAAEAIPLAGGSVDLVTAAGSLNYVADLERTFAEARRILRPSGVLAVYDFSQGTRTAGSDLLASWFREFREKYPPPVGHARRLDPEILAALPSGFEADGHESFEVPVPMSVGSYLAYVMTETNVAAAIQSGSTEELVQEWCQTGIREVFRDGSLDVLFPAYIVFMRPRV